MVQMKLYVEHTIARHFENFSVSTDQEDAITDAVMHWNHFADSEKLARRIYVHEVSGEVDNPDDDKELADLGEYMVSTGQYEIVWDSWEFEHEGIANIIDHDLEKYMEQKKVVVRHSSGVEGTAYNYIKQELEEMDAWADEPTLYKEKDWVLDTMKEKVDAVADDEVEERDKTYCLEHVEEVE